jgi:hypothetical protein
LQGRGICMPALAADLGPWRQNGFQVELWVNFR